MTEFERFKKLQEKYLDKTATPDETAEFLALYQSGKFSDLERAEFKEIWYVDQPVSARDSKIHDRILTTILTNSNYKKKTRFSKKPAVQLALAAAIALLAVAGIWQYHKSSTPEPAAPLISLQTITGPFYGKLPDGTTLQLKDSSQLTFDEASFGIKHRAVQLSGTAFFKVTKNPDVPFTVQSGPVRTSVLGTEFNIGTSRDIIAVTVMEGQVRVGDRTNTFGVIIPHEKMIVKTGDMSYSKQKTTGEAELQWRRTNLTFENTNLLDVLTRLEELFDIKITLENDALKKCPITAKFTNNESLDDMLDQITGSLGADASITGYGVTIEGGKGCD
jgi:transmembrane sensor